MSDVDCVRRRVGFGPRAGLSVAFVLSAFAAGCSADVARFDSSNFNLDDPPDAVAESVPPVPPEPVHPNAPGDAVARTTPTGPYGAGAGSVDVAALSEPAGAEQPATVRPVAQPRQYATGSTQAAARNEPPARGQQIEVAPGDTLYALSRRHHVSLAEMMSVNGLAGPNLKPGQKLYLPGEESRAAAPARRIETAALTPATPPSAAVMQKYGATYTVQAGDSLYAISRKVGAPYKELQQVNAIADVRKVRPGTVLKVPGSAPAAAETLAQSPAPYAAQARAPSTSAQPTVINGQQQVASRNDTATDAAPEAPKLEAKIEPKAEPKAERRDVAIAAPQAQTQAGDSVKLRWPAQGKVIASFGGRPDGTHNDGINISVPLGAEVHAAESGVVAYAGSELKGYGNLILIRHDNGWVTAYAHNDEVLVKRGDKIKRGQIVAKAGKTGTVDQPQVHFELRQGSKPVDPTPFMERI